MYYSSVVLLALATHIIINYNVLFKRLCPSALPVHRSYQNFLFSVSLYYFTDVLWDVLNALGLMRILFWETAIYFVVIALSIYLWTKYVIDYLNEKSFFTRILKHIGQIFFVLQVITITLNFFYKIAFWFGEDKTYYTGPARDINFLTQLIMFFATAIHMLFFTRKAPEKQKRRHRAIGLFCVSMSVFIILQALYPLLPFYAMGFMLGTCLLHTFVLEDEKETHRAELENLLQVKQIQEAELGSVRQLAYTDPLTGVKNKNAYMEDASGIERRIKENHLCDFGVAVFDVNGLKTINDTKGHCAGDKYIKAAGKLICHEFKHSPVYRIGGDEFAAFIMGSDFKNHEKLFEDFAQKMKSNLEDEKVVVSFGFSEFAKEKDKTYLNIFERADKKMYDCKTRLKNLAKNK